MRLARRPGRQAMPSNWSLRTNLTSGHSRAAFPGEALLCPMCWLALTKKAVRAPAKRPDTGGCNIKDRPHFGN